MKKYLTIAALLSAAVVGVPAVPVMLTGRANAENKPPEKPVLTEFTEDTAEQAVSSGEPYKVLDVSTGEVMEVPERDYVIGAVCAEMPASFCDEALKAQAVAAHTYAERQRYREKQSPTPELSGADFSNDTSKYQGYFTKEQAQQYFGESFETSYTKIEAAVDEVMPYIITYEDEPIISAFHSMSSGKTESAENAWGSAVDYLVPVDSSYDVAAPKYRDEVRYTKDVLKNKLETAFPGIALGEDMTQWLKTGDISDSGTVLTATAGDRSVTGTELRAALSLRSACFEINYEGEEAVITTKGYGHGVGMSQYGANAMAQEGSTWQDILLHYYPGAEIADNSEL